MMAFLVGGIFSNVFYGWLCDKYERRSLWTKAIVCGSSLLGSSICYLLMFYPFVNVMFPLAIIFLNSFIFGGFSPPGVSMMVNTCGVGKSPVVALLIASTAAAVMVQSSVSAKLMPIGLPIDQLRVMMVLNTVIPALIASFCFFMGGFDYVRKMTESNRQRAEAL